MSCAAGPYDGSRVQLDELGKFVDPVAKGEIVVVQEGHIAAPSCCYPCLKRVSPAPAFHSDRPGLGDKPRRQAADHAGHFHVLGIRGAVTADDDLHVTVGLGCERSEIVLESDKAPALGANDHAEEGCGAWLRKSQ